MNINKPFLPVLGATLVFVSYMALSPAPPHTPIDQLGDKFSHMAAFATLTVLSRLAFPAAAKLRLVEHLSFFGALIEVFQNIPALHRDCEWTDWVADTAAIGVAIVVTDALLALWRARKAG